MTSPYPQGSPYDAPQGYVPANEQVMPPQDAYTEPKGATRMVTPEEQSYQRYQAEDRSIGEIVSDVMGNASTLVKQEVELAKAEAKQTATRAGKGVGFLAGSGVAAFLALIALTLGIWWTIAVAINAADPALGWAGLWTFLLWLVVAGVLAMLGKSALDKMKGLPKTAETVSKIPNAVTGNEEKNR